jgi:hypothetical protein
MSARFIVFIEFHGELRLFFLSRPYTSYTATYEFITNTTPLQGANTSDTSGQVYAMGQEGLPLRTSRLSTIGLAMRPFMACQN